MVEIVLEVEAGSKELDVDDSPRRAQYGAFVRDNPAFLDLTAQRVASYWNGSYRATYADRDDYPGSSRLSSLQSAGAEVRSSGISFEK